MSGQPTGAVEACCTPELAEAATSGRSAAVAATSGRSAAVAATGGPAAGARAQVEADAEPRLISRAFVALALAALAFFVAGGIVLPVAPRFADGPLAADALGFGIAIAAFSIAALLARPIVGWASDRYGRRPLLILGSALTIGALLVHLVATDLAIFTLARAGLGIGEGFFFVAALAAGSDIAPPSRRGEALSFLSLSLYMGVVIGPFVGEVVLDQGGFTAVWLVSAVIAGLALLLTLLVPETAPNRLSPAATSAPAAEDGSTADGAPARGLDGAQTAGSGARLFHPKGLLPGLLILSGAWGMSGYFTFLPFYADDVGLDGAGMPLALYGLVVIGLRVVGARLPDRIGAPRLSGAAMVVSAIGLAVMGLLQTPAGLIVGTVVYATGIAFLFPAVMSCAVGLVPAAERGSVLGTTSAFLDLGFGIGPVVLSLLIADAAGAAGFGAVFLFCAVVAAGGALLMAVRRGDLVPAPIATG
jgi:MFS family permease